MKRKFNKKDKKSDKSKLRSKKLSISMLIHYLNMKDKISWLKYVRETKLIMNKKYPNLFNSVITSKKWLKFSHKLSYNWRKRHKRLKSLLKSLFQIIVKKLKTKCNYSKKLNKLLRTEKISFKKSKNMINLFNSKLNKKENN